MLFLSQKSFHRSHNREQIEDFFTRYGLHFAFMPAFILADGQEHDGWFLDELDIKFMSAVNQYDYNASELPMTPEANVQHFKLHDNEIRLPRTDFELKNIFAAGDDPAYNSVAQEFVTQNMREIFEKDLVIGTCNGRLTRSDDRTFRPAFFNMMINVRYLPTGQADDGIRTPTVTAPTSLFGIELPFNFKGFAPAPGADFNITEGGVTIAQLFRGKDLVVLFPFFCKDEFPAHAAILAHILRKTARSANANMPGIDIAFLRSTKSGVLENRKRHLRDQSQRAQSNARTYSDSLTKSLRLHAESSAELTAIEMGESLLIPNDENLGREVAQIVAMKGIKNIAVSRDKTKIFVFTETLYVENEKHKTRHVLGDFKITITLNKSPQETFLMQNLTRRGYEDHHAPHVDGNGKLCVGNMQEMLPPLIAAVDIAALIQIAIIFLQSVNYSDAWGHYIESFPVVDKDGTILDKAGTERLRAFQNASWKMPPDYAPNGVHKKYRKEKAETVEPIVATRATA